jgi:hypothetical protein
VLAFATLLSIFLLADKMLVDEMLSLPNNKHLTWQAKLASDKRSSLSRRRKKNVLIVDRLHPVKICDKNSTCKQVFKANGPKQKQPPLTFFYLPGTV